ncbi:hypothetical protein E4T81_05950 [Barnesiella sp. WM24]|uniref:hypothetical protein n=1 Tax=Barnesiella sp. WM24 TaxID=2558278 RepID=UPI0010719D36|nr:hypothetical protein [Barnesiella sp. WM24]TFU94131.1 hypothetical protein E4T81_05950 [Barnesiella sp. WM24]
MKIVSRTSDKAGELLKRLTTDILDNKNNSNNAVVVHSGRNKIWRENVGGEDVAIKIYGTSLVKSIIYIFRKTKARKAYENALELTKRGVATPAPLAYGERRGFMNRLIKSVYISVYEESTPLAHYLDCENVDVIDQFSCFTAMLHSKGILHHDLNSTNVRIIPAPGHATFSLIDINRIKFIPVGITVNLKDRFNNITRFSSLNDNYIFFVKKYLKYANLPEALFDTAIQSKSRHDTKSSRIHKIKNILKFTAKTK